MSAGVRVAVDDDFEHSMGYRINEHELAGVPVRLEVGAREAESKSVTWVRRDTMEKGTLADAEIVGGMESILSGMQSSMLEKAEKVKKDMTRDVDTWDEFSSIMHSQKMFIRAPWCEQASCEAEIKTETKATPRVLELDRIDENINAICVKCGEPAHRRWLFAQSY